MQDQMNNKIIKQQELFTLYKALSDDLNLS